MPSEIQSKTIWMIYISSTHLINDIFEALDLNQIVLEHLSFYLKFISQFKTLNWIFCIETVQTELIKLTCLHKHLLIFIWRMHFSLRMTRNEKNAPKCVTLVSSTGKHNIPVQCNLITTKIALKHNTNCHSDTEHTIWVSKLSKNK